MNLSQKKIFIFVSTGRCGTVRLTEILEKNLSETFYASHQKQNSRRANVIGNIYYAKGKSSNNAKIKIFEQNLSYTDKKNIIITDPLVSMMIPDEMIVSKNVFIFHIFRDKRSFAKSFFSFSRKKIKSFIAHNFIPYWQPGVLPLQNLFLGKRMLKKYENVADIKYDWFIKHYSKNPNFISKSMEEVFNTNILQGILQNFFNEQITISIDNFQIKSNTSAK